MLQSSASQVEGFATLVATNQLHQLQQLRREKETSLLEARLRLRQYQEDRLVQLLACQAETLKQQLEQEREREQRLLFMFLKGQQKG
jgi:hypothetical protein